MELNFNGIFEAGNERLDNRKTVIIKTEQPRCRMHCKIEGDTILFNDNSIPAIGDMVECRMRVEIIDKGNIYGTMCSWFKMKNYKKVSYLRL